MKALFITYNTLSKIGGISKKIIAQKEALEKNGLDVGLFYSDTDSNGNWCFKVDNDIIYTCQRNPSLLVKIKHQITGVQADCFDTLVEYVKKNDIKFIYIRYTHFATPFVVSLFKKLKKQGVILFLEIPTYPYDNEYNGFIKSRQYYIEHLYRKKMAKYIDKIVTFSDDDYIWNRPTIKITNGVDFDKIKLKKNNDKSNNNVLNMIGVAVLMFWHGFDRVIEGIYQYYKSEHIVSVFFNIVGIGDEEGKLKELVKKYGLEKYVIFHGPKYGKDLDDIYDENDIAIGCLGCHRKNIFAVKSIKNVEYAARGIPFIYSENNDDFDDMPYILKVSADEKPIDINSIIKFYNSTNWNSVDIKNSIAGTLSWKKQMEKVVNNISL